MVDTFFEFHTPGVLAPMHGCLLMCRAVKGMFRLAGSYANLCQMASPCWQCSSSS